MILSEEDIYKEHVLDHFEAPYHRGPCEKTTHSHEGKNALCGDIVKVDLALSDEGQIEQASFQGEGCVITLASALDADGGNGRQRD